MLGKRMTQPSLTTFDEKKAAEVAFFFLSKARAFNQNITKLRFIKWMYLAERASYQRFGEPLTGDSLYSMQHGPVVSEVLRLIEQSQRPTSFWDEVVKVEPHKKHKYVSVAYGCAYQNTDDLLALSDSEIHLLEEIWAEYGRKSANELERFLHDPKSCPEWSWEKGQWRNPIELEQLLSKLGYSDDQAHSLIERLHEREAINQAFAA